MKRTCSSWALLYPEVQTETTKKFQEIFNISIKRECSAFGDERRKNNYALAIHFSEQLHLGRGKFIIAETGKNYVEYYSQFDISPQKIFCHNELEILYVCSYNFKLAVICFNEQKKYCELSLYNLKTDDYNLYCVPRIKISYIKIQLNENHLECVESINDQYFVDVFFLERTGHLFRTSSLYRSI